jgi:hypothetical protein
MTKRALLDENKRLRTELQACQSRSRLALQALRWLHERLMVLGRDKMTVEDLSEFTLRMDNLATLLAGKEVEHG